MFASVQNDQDQYFLRLDETMKTSGSQGQLFDTNVLQNGKTPPREFKISRKVLLNWQFRLHEFQANLFGNEPDLIKQSTFFNTNYSAVQNQFDPLKLKPLPLSFWRLPSMPHKGPAIYLVMDKPKILINPLLLYIGETVAAERRWKGNHDCKAYLSSYSDALANVGLNKQLSIRFWTDVPCETKARRELEQALIQRWLPPFNKETRTRWNTPFTNEII